MRRMREQFPIRLPRYAPGNPQACVICPDSGIGRSGTDRSAQFATLVVTSTSYDVVNDCIAHIALGGEVRLDTRKGSKFGKGTITGKLSPVYARVTLDKSDKIRETPFIGRVC